jgi:membrane-bound serine protease (ClpP class)
MGLAILRHLLFALVVATGGTAVAATAPVIVLKLQDAVDPASADYVVRGIRKAAETQAPLVVIEVDTPGGLDSSMRRVIQAMLDSPVPVAVYVSPSGARAASAGTYILYAAHVAAMAPATTLGAATPVPLEMGGMQPGKAREPAREAKDAASQARPNASQPAPDAMTAKQVHDAAAFIRGLAQLRGRNAEWAERAVREAVSLTSGEAVKEHVIDFVAADLADLLAQADGRTVKVAGGERKLATRGAAYETRLPDWREQLLAVIAHPNVALILMMVGVWGIFFEFAAPGHGVSGVTGAICLLLAAFALQMLSVNYAGVGLVLLGAALLVAELFAPSFGVLGVGGIAALAAGGLLLFDTQTQGFGVSASLVLALAAASGAVVFAGSALALRTRRRPVVSGHQTLVGATGHVIASVTGENWAEVQGERWRVAAPRMLAPGEHVRVTAVDGLTLRVQPIPQGEEA